MTQSQANVKEFMLKVGQDCPGLPTIPNQETRILRVRLLLEEVLELAAASGLDIVANSVRIESCDDFSITPTRDVDLLEVADAIADISYINYGTAISYGLDLEPFEEEVHSNNLSKIETGYKDENGKWRKGPDYKPVDLKPILEQQLQKSSS